jgi:hypothetical protein
MNKKIIQGILVAGVIGVWAVVGYRVFMNMKSPTEVVITQPSLINPNAKKEVRNERKLALNYGDPFLRNQVSERPAQPNISNVSRMSAPPAKKVQEPTPVVKEVWPDFIYKGIISNKKKGQDLAILSINGSEKIVKPGEEVSGFIIKEFNADKVVVLSKGKEVKAFERK